MKKSKRREYLYPRTSTTAITLGRYLERAVKDVMVEEGNGGGRFSQKYIEWVKTRAKERGII